MKDVVIEGYNWTKFPFREDPITHRRLCFDCWNQRHGEWHDNGTRKWFEAGCKVANCGCACFDDVKAQLTERSKKSARTKERKSRMSAMLSDDANPLRAVNGDFKQAKL